MLVYNDIKNNGVKSLLHKVVTDNTFEVDVSVMCAESKMRKDVVNYLVIIGHDQCYGQIIMDSFVVDVKTH